MLQRSKPLMSNYWFIHWILVRSNVFAFGVNLCVGGHVWGGRIRYLRMLNLIIWVWRFSKRKRSCGIPHQQRFLPSSASDSHWCMRHTCSKLNVWQLLPTLNRTSMKKPFLPQRWISASLLSSFGFLPFWYLQTRISHEISSFRLLFANDRIGVINSLRLAFNCYFVWGQCLLYLKKDWFSISCGATVQNLLMFVVLRVP